MSLPKNGVRDKTDLTCAARLTGAGRSAVAVIAVAGPQSGDTLSRLFVPASKTPIAAGQVRFGRWGDAATSHVAVATEDVVLTPLADDSYEIHCHGGAAAITRILDDLRHLGVKIVDGWDWAGVMPGDRRPLAIREAESVLARCQTTRFAAVALDQTRGVLVDWAADARQACSVDTPDLGSIRQQAKNFLEHSKWGLRLGNFFRVVLSGPPNVGKSSLLNAIVGYDRSITLDLAGTTRDLLHADTVIDGIPIRLSDTAGVREAVEPIEQQGVTRALAAVADADLVVLVEQPGIESRPTPPTIKTIRLLNKADLIGDIDVPNVDFRTVATTGEGVPELMRAIGDSLIDTFPPPGTPVPVHPRQARVLGEIVESATATDVHAALSELIGDVPDAL